MGFLQINVEKVTGSGDAKDVICSSVKKLGADTLVMGSHGYGFFQRYHINRVFMGLLGIVMLISYSRKLRTSLYLVFWVLTSLHICRALLGSVSDYCAKHVKCPVVIVKHRDDK